MSVGWFGTSGQLSVDLRSSGRPYLQGRFKWWSTLRTVDIDISSVSHINYTADFIIQWSWSMDSDAPREM